MLQHTVTVARSLVIATLVAVMLAACSKSSPPPEPAATDAAPAQETSAAQEAPAAQDASATTTTDSTASAQTGTAEPGAPASSSAPQKLDMTDIKKGTGPAIKAGQTAVVHYTGWLYAQDAPEQKGTKFDSSHDRNEPFPFPLGAGRVIPGWDQGVVGMQVGGQRRLVIPPELGYGARGAGGVIPPNATLVFDVELLAIQ
jgi:FKBP-type peptidyl-prolyl cis-trans isomerase